MENLEIQLDRICDKCSNNFRIRKPKNLDKKRPDITSCTKCRSFKICPSCNAEFNHHQNQTCSKICSENLKKKTYLLTTGKEHNFCKGSSSRKNFEKRLLEEYGIINIFQREDVKQSLKKTWEKNYGVDNPSKSNEIKLKKKITLSKTLLINPNLFKNNWYNSHKKFIDTLGYDPRLQAISQTSKESLLYFIPLIRILDSLNIKYYIGIEGSREFCIRDKENKKSYFYDLCIPTINLIVEYNGTTWHAKNDKNWKHPFTDQSYEENKKYFERKIELANKKGFEVIVIWSDDSDKNIILENIIKRINENKID